MKRDTQMNNMALHSKMQIWVSIEEQALLAGIDFTGQLGTSWSIYKLGVVRRMFVSLPKK